MKRFIVLFCIFLLCHCQDDEREPKLFFGPKVQTVVSYRRVPEIVTEFIPSSCVVIEPTLPACRHVRNLEIYPSIPTRIAKTQIPQISNPQPVETQNWKPSGTENIHKAPTPPLKGKPQQVKFTPPYWNWNLFNIFRVQNFTHTATKTEYITTKVEDPNTVVSFYIKGCRPSKLPFNLPECAQPEEVVQQEKNIVVMAPLKFIPSDEFITPSKSKVLKVDEKVEQEQKQDEKKEVEEEEEEEGEPEEVQEKGIEKAYETNQTNTN